MSDEPTSSFATKFCARTKAIREATGWTQAKMAKALGVPEETYKNTNCLSITLRLRLLRSIGLL